MTDATKTSGDYAPPARRYRARPAECEAMQWTGHNAAEIRRWMNQPSHQYGLGLLGTSASLWVKKAQRWIGLPVGDFIIAEPDGDGFYPCAAHIFIDRWDPIEAAPSGSPATEADRG